MKKLTQAEFEMLKRNRSVFIEIPAHTDCTKIDFNGVDAIRFGNGCKLGEFINCRATFEGGRVKNGLHLTVGNIGSEHRTAYFFIDENGTLFVRAGCWFSEMNAFKERVRTTHSGTVYETEYMAACAYAETVLPAKLAAWGKRV